ncbi:MAG: hypothetical protein ACJ763_15865 [Bdellovibrionia bacterium]
MMKFNVLVCVSVLSVSALALAAAPSPSPSPAAPGGRNVRAKMGEPKHAKPVGVQAADPTQNGKVNTSTALSPINANSMGLGVQFDLNPPKKTAPKKADKDAEEAE